MVSAGFQGRMRCPQDVYFFYLLDELAKQGEWKTVLGRGGVDGRLTRDVTRPFDCIR